MLTRIVRLFTEHWTLKLAALGLAVLLWLAVRAEARKAAVFRNIPVQVDLRDPDWRLVGDPDPAAVQVTVWGSTPELMRLASNPPFIVLPVERVNDAVESQVLPLHWVQFPRGVDVGQARVVGLRPDTVRLRYERLASKTVPVRVRTRGDLPEGYALALPIRTNPATVQVRGPIGVIEDLDSVPLVPVRLSGLRSTTNVPTRVDSAAVGRRVRFTPETVNVILRVLPVTVLTPPVDTLPEREDGA